MKKKNKKKRRKGICEWNKRSHPNKEMVEVKRKIILIFLLDCLYGRLAALWSELSDLRKEKGSERIELLRRNWNKIALSSMTCNELENEDGNEKDSTAVSKQSVNMLYQLVALITQQLVICFMCFACCLSLVHPTRSKEHNYPWLYVCSWSASNYKYYVIIYCFVFINL